MSGTRSGSKSSVYPIIYQAPDFCNQLGCGGIFSPTTAVVAHWFKKRRGLAMGYMAAGASVGGTLFPIIAKNLLPLVG